MNGNGHDLPFKVGSFLSVVVPGTPSIQYTQLETVTMIQLSIGVHF